MQRQDSLFDQMVDVQKKAVEMGCYDAADWITRNFFAPHEAHVRQKIRDMESIGQSHPRGEGEGK